MKSLNKFQDKSNVLIFLFLLSLSSLGFGNKIMGISLFTDISTLIIFLLFISICFTSKVKIPNWLLFLYVFIFFHSLCNFHFEIKHFLGFILFSFTLSLFVANYRHNISYLIRVYLRYLNFLSIYTICQVVLSVFSNNLINLNDFLFSGIFELRKNDFLPEIFGILPRAIGLSAEPGHFSILLLPGVYMILLQFSRVKIDFLISRSSTFLILIAFLLSFSIVGYFGFLLCVFNIFRVDIIKNFKNVILIIIVVLGMFFAVFTNPQLIYKISSLVNMSKDATGYEYSTSDATGFALVSNLIVAKYNLIGTYYMGSGIDTHQYAYDKIIYSQFPESSLLNLLNVRDGGSLLIRIPSEFGIFGCLLVVYFLFKHKIKFDFANASEKMVLNNLAFIMILAFSFRNGDYLSPFLWFFISIYFYSYKMKSSKKIKLS